MLPILLSLSLVLTQLSITLENLKIDNFKEEEKVTFNKLPFELQKVALCESGGKQSINNKTIKSKTGDLGIMQINEKVHNLTAKNLDLDLHNPNDNMKFALWLYQKEGLKPWIASKYCWNKNGKIDTR